jgi:hypothetical protein
MQEVLSDPVLGEPGRTLATPDARRVGFVLAEQQSRFPLSLQMEYAELVMLGPNQRIRGWMRARRGLG